MLLSFKKWLLESCSGGMGTAIGISGSIAVKAGPFDLQTKPSIEGIRDPKQDQLPPKKKKPKLVNNQIQY